MGCPKQQRFWIVCVEFSPSTQEKKEYYVSAVSALWAEKGNTSYPAPKEMLELLVDINTREEGKRKQTFCYFVWYLFFGTPL